MCLTARSVLSLFDAYGFGKTQLKKWQSAKRGKHTAKTIRIGKKDQNKNGFESHANALIYANCGFSRVVLIWFVCFVFVAFFLSFLGEMIKLRRNSATNLRIHMMINCVRINAFASRILESYPVFLK